MKVKYVFLILLLAGSASAQFTIGPFLSGSNYTTLTVNRTYMDFAVGDFEATPPYGNTYHYTASAGDKVDSISVYIYEDGDSILPLIYEYDGTGDTVLFYQPTDWCVASGANDTVTITFSQVALTAGKTYCMAMIGAGSTPRPRSLNQLYSGNYNSTAAPVDPWTMGSVINSRLCIRAFGDNYPSAAGVNKTYRTHPYGSQNRLTDRRIEI